VREQNLAMNSSDEEILDANRKDLRDWLYIWRVWVKEINFNVL
jgi:hypothetical protein